MAADGDFCEAIYKEQEVDICMKGEAKMSVVWDDNAHGFIEKDDQSISKEFIICEKEWIDSLTMDVKASYTKPLSVVITIKSEHGIIKQLEFETDTINVVYAKT